MTGSGGQTTEPAVAHGVGATPPVARAMPRADRAVVFDIDDTLYLERDYVRSGFSAVGAWAQAELGVVGLGEHAWAAFDAGVRGTIFDTALAGCGVADPAAVIPRLVAAYREHAPTIELLDDARACLDRLVPTTAVGVITDGPLASQRAKATALGLDRWIDLVVFTAELGAGRGKPHAAAFEHIEQQLGLSGPACTYVADNPAKDFAAPHRMGWRTVRVRRAGGLHHAIEGGSDIDAEISTLDQLVEVLAG